MTQKQLHMELKRFLVELSLTYDLQNKQVKTYLYKSKAFYIMKIILSSLATLGMFLSIFLPILMLQIITVMLSVAALTLVCADKGNTYERSYQKSQQHIQKIWELKEESFMLLSQLCYSPYEEEEMVKQFQLLCQKREKLYANLLLVSSRTHKKLSASLDHVSFSSNDFSKIEPYYIPEALRFFDENK